MSDLAPALAERGGAPGAAQFRGQSFRVNMGMVAFCAASSIPMSYFAFVLPAVLRHAGHAAEIVALISLAYLPYALRVLWAPLIDRLGKGVPSRYRAMVLFSLVLALGSLAGFLPFHPTQDVAGIIAVAALVFFFLATGLTALDGYALATLGEGGRKRVTAYQAAGFTLGGIVLGVGAIAADGAPWPVSVLLLVLATALLALPLLRLPKATRVPAAAGPAGAARGLWSFLKAPNIRRRIEISLLAHGGYGLAAGYMPVLQVDSGLSPGQTGMFGAVGSNICGLLATFVAGALLIRIGGWRTLLGICAASVAFFVFAACFHDTLGGPAFAVSLSLGAMALGYCYVVPYRALVLIACDGERGATQAAFLSSLDVIVVIVSASLAGVVVTAFGLTGLFSLSAALSAAGAFIALQALIRSDETYVIHQERSLP